MSVRRLFVCARPMGADASGQALSFVVAGSVFVVCLGAILANANSADPTYAAQRATLEARSDDLYAAMLDASGSGWDGGADGVQSFGLANDAGLVDMEKLAALVGDGHIGTPDDGRIDYLELRRLLGVPDDLAFQLRVEPTGGVQWSLAELHLIYIADIHPPTEPPGWDIANPPPIGGAIADEWDVDEAVLTEHSGFVAMGLDYDGKVDAASPHFPATCLPAQPPPPAPPTPPAPMDQCYGPDDLEGDVLIADTQVIADRLPGKLDDADVVAVGTGVYHNVLDHPVIRDALRDFVMGGGVLLVMGTQTPDELGFLADLFADATDTHGHPSQGDDPGHSAFRTPNRLEMGQVAASAVDDVQYPDQHAWTIMQHIWRAQSGARTSQVAVSDPGAVADGGISITGYRTEPPLKVDKLLSPMTMAQEMYENAPDPGSLPTVSVNSVSRELIENLITVHYLRHVTLRLGDAPPDQGTVSTTQRLTDLVYTQGAMVPAHVTVHAWRT